MIKNNYFKYFLFLIPMLFIFNSNVFAISLDSIPNDYSSILSDEQYNFFVDKCSTFDSCIVIRRDYISTSDMFFIFENPVLSYPNSNNIQIVGKAYLYKVSDYQTLWSTQSSNTTIYSVYHCSVFYSNNVDVSLFNSTLIYSNSTDSISDSFSSVSSSDLYFAGDSTHFLKGLYNIAYESSKVFTNYIINYYYNDVIDESKSINGIGYIGDSIDIINKSDSIYYKDNNTYSYVLTNSDNIISIYYYDDYFGTDYDSLNTSNSEIYLPFSMSYINDTFKFINFHKFTQFQQFVICLGINIFFIVFLFFFLRIVRMILSYILRLF